MATPIARFLTSPSGLTIQFRDLSLNSPISWNWDFGDTNSSTDASPLHTYSSEGTYLVTLTVTNADGSDTVSWSINVSESNLISLSILDQVILMMPIAYNINPSYVNLEIQKWQTILYRAAGVNSSAMFIESNWPPLYLTLISRLVVFDYLTKIINESIILNNSTSSSTGSSSSPIKKIVTGPTEVEYFDSNKAVAEFLKNTGFMANLQSMICGLASTIGVKLDICSSSKSPFIPKKITY